MEQKSANKSQHDNRLTRSESNFYRDYNPTPTVNARLPSGGVCALTFAPEMNPIESAEQDFEAEWDSFVVSRCDFRPHWDGDLVNLVSVVDIQEDESTTERFMKDCARAIARWVGEHEKRFGAEDRFQIVIGWPKSVRRTGRQVIKTGGTFEHLKSLADGTTEIEMRRGWTYSVFPTTNQANKAEQDDAYQRPC